MKIHQSVSAAKLKKKLSAYSNLRIQIRTKEYSGKIKSI